MMALVPMARGQEDPPPEERGVETAAPEAAPPASTPTTESPAPSEAMERGRALFQAAADALAQAQSITYRARSSATGELFVRTGRVVEADIRQARQPGGILPGWRMRVIGTSSGPGGQGASTEFDTAWLTANVEWVDHENKKVIEKPFQEARRARAVMLSTPVRLEDMTAYRPFSKEIAGVSYEFEARQEVRGVLCDVVVVAINNGRTRARWHLSVDDHLPRRVERLIETRSGTASNIVEFSEMRVETSPPTPALLAGLRVPVAEGYAEDRPANAQPAGVPVEPTPVPGPTPGVNDPAVEKPVVPVAAAGPVTAPGFDLATPTGERVTLESLRGRVVVLEFGGSWCVNLRHARPELAALLDRFKDQPVRAFAMSVREKNKDAAVSGHAGAPAGLGLLLGAEAVAGAYRAETFPAYAVVGPEGELLAGPSAYVPETTMEDLGRVIDEAVRKIPAPTPSPGS